MKSYIKYIILVFTAILLYYFLLPAINIHDIKLWLCIILLAIEFCILDVSTEQKIIKVKNKSFAVPNIAKSKTSIKVMILVLAVSFIYIFATAIIYSPIFMSGSYANRINIEEVSFDEIPTYSFNTTAIIDRDSASKLGNKVMGEMLDLISQFTASDEYSQISYQEGTYRVTPLKYDGFIKYLKNRSEGVPGYIIVNTTTGETSLKRLDKKLRYVPSAYFNEDLMRKLRFSYPFEIFGSPTFEIDEEGNPYYICTTYTYKGVSSLKRVTGAVLFNPVDGSSTKYDIENIPTWVDRIFPEDLVNEELNDFGSYSNGFFNSFIGQEGVMQTSEGYNYISKNGDIWLYTGITSVLSDDSNIGFALVNLRTHQAQLINTSGADEYSVMASAEGEVLNYGYTATFPVLVNIDNKPIYLLSLKDSAGLVKMYAMVDAQDYQQVYTISADKDTKTAIEDLIKKISKDPTAIYQNLSEAIVTVDRYENISQNGNTTIFILDSNDMIYEIPYDSSYKKYILFLNSGDTLELLYEEINGIRIVKQIISKNGIK